MISTSSISKYCIKAMLTSFIVGEGTFWEVGRPTCCTEDGLATVPVHVCDVHIFATDEVA